MYVNDHATSADMGLWPNSIKFQTSSFSLSLSLFGVVVMKTMAVVDAVSAKASQRTKERCEKKRTRWK